MSINIQKIKNGDHEEFEYFVRLYKDAAFRFAVKLLADVDLAEDIVQDSFVKLYVYREKIDLHKSLKSYLFTIIHNKVVDYHRTEKLHTNFLPKIFKEKLEVKSPENILLEKEKFETINANITKLDSIKRKALYLYSYEEMSYAEVADTLNISLSKTKIIIYRARKELLAIMEVDK